MFLNSMYLNLYYSRSADERERTWETSIYLQNKMKICFEVVSTKSDKKRKDVQVWNVDQILDTL